MKSIIKKQKKERKDKILMIRISSRLASKLEKMGLNIPAMVREYLETV